MYVLKRTWFIWFELYILLELSIELKEQLKHFLDYGLQYTVEENILARVTFSVLILKIGYQISAIGTGNISDFYKQHYFQVRC